MSGCAESVGNLTVAVEIITKRRRVGEVSIDRRNLNANHNTVFTSSHTIANRVELLLLQVQLELAMVLAAGVPLLAQVVVVVRVRRVEFLQNAQRRFLLVIGALAAFRAQRFGQQTCAQTDKKCDMFGVTNAMTVYQDHEHKLIIIQCHGRSIFTTAAQRRVVVYEIALGFQPNEKQHIEHNILLVRRTFHTTAHTFTFLWSS